MSQLKQEQAESRQQRGTYSFNNPLFQREEKQTANFSQIKQMTQKPFLKEAESKPQKT